MVVSYVAVEALNAWSLFSRSFYLSCAIGARTERKKAISFAQATSDHLGAAITHYKRNAVPNVAGAWHRRDEPTWHDPNVLMTVCKNLGCSIQPEIEIAFSLGQDVFNDLPVCRNFFAHRNEQTSHAARSLASKYTLPTPATLTDFLVAVSPGNSAPVLLTWIGEINVTAEFICKA